MATPKKTRLNVRVPSDLLKWIKKYAKDHNTTVTQLIVSHFMDTKTGGPDPFTGIDKLKEASHG